jgi:hypothetical protein
MRAAAFIVAVLAAVIATITVRFFTEHHSQAALAQVAADVPEPSQMTATEYSSALIAVLQRSDPDVWHQVAMGWNWDGGVAPLEWMIRQPKCDRGTALLIYWRGGPGFFKQYARREDVPPELSSELFNLLEEVEGRFMSGFYTRQEIAFNPRSDDTYDWTTRYAEAVGKIPAQMFAAAPGREVLKACVYLPPRLRCS